MSAEVENSKEEEVKEQKVRRPLKKKILEHWPAGIKVLELLICVVCMGLIYDPIVKVDYTRVSMHHVGVMYTSYTGYMVINCVLLISRILGDKVPYRTVSIFAIIGSALFLVTGILLIVDANDFVRNQIRSTPYLSTYDENLLKNLIKVSAGFAFLNALLFAAEGVLTFKYQDQDL